MAVCMTVVQDHSVWQGIMVVSDVLDHKNGNIYLFIQHNLTPEQTDHNEHHIVKFAVLNHTRVSFVFHSAPGLSTNITLAPIQSTLFCLSVKTDIVHNKQTKKK